MSEDKNFLSRWSRKKRAAVEPPPQAAAPAAEDAKPKESTAAAAAAPAGGAKGARTEADQPKFDLASLPSLESIGADTDIRPVPASRRAGGADAGRAPASLDGGSRYPRLHRPFGEQLGFHQARRRSRLRPFRSRHRHQAAGGGTFRGRTQSGRGEICRRWRHHPSRMGRKRRGRRRNGQHLWRGPKITID